MYIRMIEITNRCNMDCWFCPHSIMERPQGDISIQTIKTAVSKMIGMGQTQVCLNNLGEPLLHPKFFEIAEIVSSSDIAACVVTNINALDYTLADNLIKSNLSKIQISMDFATEDGNLIAESMVDDPRVVLNIKGIDRKSIVDFRNRWGSNCVIKFITNIAGQMDFKPDTNPQGICVFRDINNCVLFWDGRISTCCYDINGKYILGTIDNVDKINQLKDCDMCKNCCGIDMRAM